MLEAMEPFQRFDLKQPTKVELGNFLRANFAKPTEPLTLPANATNKPPVWAEIADSGTGAKVYLALDRENQTLAFALPPKKGPIYDELGIMAPTTEPLHFYSTYYNQPAREFLDCLDRQLEDKSPADALSAAHWDLYDLHRRRDNTSPILGSSHLTLDGRYGAIHVLREHTLIAPQKSAGNITEERDLVASGASFNSTSGIEVSTSQSILGTPVYKGEDAILTVYHGSQYLKGSGDMPTETYREYDPVNNLPRYEIKYVIKGADQKIPLYADSYRYTSLANVQGEQVLRQKDLQINTPLAELDSSRRQPGKHLKERAFVWHQDLKAWSNRMFDDIASDDPFAAHEPSLETDDANVFKTISNRISRFMDRKQETSQLKASHE